MLGIIYKIFAVLFALGAVLSACAAIYLSDFILLIVFVLLACASCLVWLKSKEHP